MKNNRYLSLLKNTFIFGIGTFSSKILVFLLMPLYTFILSKEEFGTVDLIIQTANFMLPIVSLGISQSVIRFALEKEENKAKVFSAGLQIFSIGYLAFLLLSPILEFVPFVRGYLSMLVLFVLTSSLRSLCSQFIKGLQKNKLYSLDGVLTTLTTLLFTVYFLVYAKMGIMGYILAIICSDFLSVLFLFFTAKLWKYIVRKTSGFKKRMLSYSLPMIPTTIFWWITNVSDRYMIGGMLGSAENGLYAVSYKIPTIMILISTIFLDAWQISSVTEDETKRKSFFSNVFEGYSSLLFLASSLIILLCKPILSILVDIKFYDAWVFIPILVMATTFSCFVSFFGSIYMLYKKSTHAMWTTLIGAVLNIGMNFLLIPLIGVQGAAIATFLSYVIVFIIRTIDVRKFLKFNWDYKKIIISACLVLLQAIIMILNVPFWVLFSILILATLITINLKNLLSYTAIFKRK